MALRSVVLFAHLLGAIVLVGGSLSGPLLLAAVRRADEVAAVRSLLRYARDAARANPPAALIVLLTGVYLGRGRWSEAWLVISLVVFVASSVISLAIVEATERRIERFASTAADGTAPGEPIARLRASFAWEGGADAQLANDLTLLYLMVQQPGLAGSLVVVLLANAAALAYPLLRRRHAAPAAAALRG